LSRSRTVVAHFEAGERTPGPSRLPTDHKLTVRVSGDGTVSGDPGEIEACSLECSDSFPEGQRIVLTADESGGSSFAGWDHPGCDESTTCTLTLERDTTVEAGFERDAPQQTKHELTVVVSGEGTVSSRPGGIDECATSCQARFDEGERIILTARAGDGWELAGWDGAGCGSDTTCSLTLDGTRQIEATFRREVRPTEIAITSVTPEGEGGNYPALIVSGRLGGAPPGSTVEVRYQTPESADWRDAPAVTTQDGGSFRVTVPFTYHGGGTWTFEARYAGTSGYERSRSAPFSWDVPG